MIQNQLNKIQISFGRSNKLLGKNIYSQTLLILETYWLAKIFTYITTHIPRQKYLLKMVGNISRTGLNFIYHEVR